MLRRVLIHRYFVPCGLVACVLAILVLLPASAAEFKTFGERVVIFEFDRPKSEQLSDYFLTILAISDEVFASEMARTRGLRSARSKLQPNVDFSEEDIAREMGVQHYITGQYKFLRSNLRISAQWVDLERKLRAESLGLVGKDQLNDFDQVEKKVRKLVQDLLAAYSRSTSESGERLLVTCFIDDVRGGSSLLSTLISLELPYHLTIALAKQGVSPEKLSVEGLTLSGTRRQCDETLLEVREFGEARYLLAGAIIQEKEHIVIKPLLFDQTERRGISISSVTDTAPRGKELSRTLSRLANNVAERLRNVLVQRRLREEGFNPGRIDGVLGRETLDALAIYQDANMLPKTGRLDKETLNALGLQ